MVDASERQETMTLPAEERERLQALLAVAVRDDEPHAALRAVTALRRELERLEATHVDNAVRAGSSWRRIGEALDVSKQAAHRRHRSHAPAAADDGARRGSSRPGRLLVTAEARGAVRDAHAEARALGHCRAGTGHLLLGVLRSPDGPAVRALRDAGVTLERARACTDAPPPGGDGSALSRRARAVLEQSLREALELGDGFIAVEHVLLALLRDDDGAAARLLARIDVDRAALTAALARVTPGADARAA